MAGLFVVQLRTLISYEMKDGTKHQVVTDYFNEEYLGSIEDVLKSHLPKIPSSGFIEVNPTEDQTFELVVHVSHPVRRGASTVLTTVKVTVKPVMEAAGRYFEVPEIKGVKYV